MRNWWPSLHDVKPVPVASKLNFSIMQQVDRRMHVGRGIHLVTSYCSSNCEDSRISYKALEVHGVNRTERPGPVARRCNREIRAVGEEVSMGSQVDVTISAEFPKNNR